MVREPFAADLPRSIEQANTTFTTPRPLQEDGDECFERRNFERREREVASNFNVDAGDTESPSVDTGFGWGAGGMWVRYGGSVRCVQYPDAVVCA